MNKKTKNQHAPARTWKPISKRVLTVASVLAMSMSAFAQSKTVTGTIVDSNGEPVIGASAIVKGTSNGGITDLDGKFTITNVPENASIQVTYVGYKAQLVPVKGKNTFKIILQEDNTSLDDVVVIGYGSVKKSTLTAAVSKMDAKGIENRTLARAETALQGQLAGVQVRTTNGEPGSDMQIRVRGAASVNASSDPLYVVDGVPMDNLSGINPADIQSIEVLKDAASAAIYGSRGSNGVVMVTTKKGKSGKPQISFSAQYGIQQMEKKMDVLSATEWMEFRLKYNDAYYLSQAKSKGVTNASIKDSNEVRLKNLKLTSPNYNVILDDRWFQYLSQDIRDSHTYTATDEQLSLLDWQDEFYRNAAIQDYNINVAGGSDRTSYMFSGGYMNQEGIARGTGYERFSLRTKVESKINNYITVGLNLAPTYIVQDGAGMANGKDSQAHQVLTFAPVSGPGVGYMANANGNEKYLWGSQNASSPTFYMDDNTNQSRVMKLAANGFVRVTPIKNLSVELTGAAQYYDKDANSYYTTAASKNWPQGEGAKSSGRHQTDRYLETLVQAVANYNFTLGKIHDFNAMIGASAEKTSVGYSTDQNFSGPFPNDAIQGSFDGSLVGVKTNTVTEKTPKKLTSFFGRLQYNLAEKYMLSASLRYDGCSVFGADNKWGVFPAASAGWLVSNEKFFKNWNIKWWNTLKFRASYGETGNNNISNTAAYPTLTSTTYAGQNGYYANSLGNNDLGWEKTKSTDLAVDLAFFNNRIQLSFDYYTKKTTDLLYQVPVPGASGFTTVWDNLGDIDNHGFEIELNTKNLTGGFKWDTSFNVSYNQNEVKSLGVDDTPVYSGFSGSNYSNVLMVGKPINTFWMYDAIGVWKTQAEIDAYSAAHDGTPVTFEGKKIKPGDIRYRDVNNDGKITADDKDYLGQPTPKFVFGMTNTFHWKDFDMSVLMTAQTGGKIFGVFGRANDRPSMGAASNVLGRWRNAWWSEEDQGDGKTPYILSSTTGATLDSRWLYSSDYLRIKNLTIGYKLPINPKLISYARIYFSVENLKCWNHYYGGYSPEAANTASSSSPGGQSALGLDYGSYPLSRTYTLGININF